MTLEEPSPLKSRFQIPFNYLFFSAYFLITAAVHVFHVFLVESPPNFSLYFFVVFAVGQSLLETAFLVLVGALIRRYCHRVCYQIFIGLAFILLLTHLIDFPLLRLMGMSFWFSLHFVLQGSYENFIELLLASNVSLFIWAVAGGAVLSVILGGVWLYRISETWTDRRPFVVSYSQLAAVICTTGLFLFVWETSTVGYTVATHFETYEHTLPWKNTFLPVKKEYVTLEHPLKEPEEEEAVFRKLDSRAFSLSRQPDIFLFVMESLREDYITPKIAPNLHQFKQDHVSFDLAFSNANATQLSWFSIFFSQFPFYFGKMTHENWKGGALPLRLLKKMGYKVYVYSSARLNYFDMDQLILGESCYLADRFSSFECSEFEEVFQKDQYVVDQMIQEMRNPSVSSGRVFLVFLDATHHDYSWPMETESHFHPFESQVNYFKAAVSNKGLEGIRNRYRNALHFVDGLFGKFVHALNEYPGGKDAVVVVTGDHAEEFYEQGYLFHASALSHQQTHVPLYYKFGETEQVAKWIDRKLSSHMDIFPSVFHYLFGEDLFNEVLQGQSIFSPHHWPYVVTARFNAGRSPYEFSIHNGTDKVLARFTNQSDIFNSPKLRILAAKTVDDEYLPIDLPSIKERFGEAIDTIFRP